MISIITFQHKISDNELNKFYIKNEILDFHKLYKFRINILAFNMINNDIKFPIVAAHSKPRNQKFQNLE